MRVDAAFQPVRQSGDYAQKPRRGGRNHDLRYSLSAKGLHRRSVAGVTGMGKIGARRCDYARSDRSHRVSGVLHVLANEANGERGAELRGRVERRTERFVGYFRQRIS